MCLNVVFDVLIAVFRYLGLFLSFEDFLELCGVVLVINGGVDEVHFGASSLDVFFDCFSYFASFFVVLILVVSLWFKPWVRDELIFPCLIFFQLFFQNALPLR